MRHGYRGRLVLFEGVDGSGKSTQVTWAKTWADAGSCATERETVLTKEPYTKTPDGRPVYTGLEIYQILKGEHARTRLADITTDQFQRHFYFHNRVMHHLDVVIPALERGDLVLSDRGLASVCFGAMNPAMLYRLMAEQLELFEVTKLPWPDAVIIYDVPVETAMQRLRDSGKVADGHENPETLTRVRENYQLFARNWPNCHLVDASGSVEKVFKEGTVPILDRVLNEEVYRQRAEHGVIG